MKELSIEEKAKAYDEALEKGKQIQNTPYTAHWDTMKEVVGHLLPELAESEEEKTKRLLHTIANKMGQHLRDIFTEEEFQCFDAWSNAWLEKQGEQKDKLEDAVLDSNKDGLIADTIRCKIEKQGELKPAWSEEDESNISELCSYIRESYKKEDAESLINWLKSLRPQTQQESIEDKVNNFFDVLDDCGYMQDEILRLKSIWKEAGYPQPQSTWKPSDAQIRELSIVATGKGWFSTEILSELLEQLKKLKDEK